MLQLQTNGASFTTAFSNYAATKNARFKMTDSNVISVQDRWNETYNSLPEDERYAIDVSLEAAKAEFRRRNPTIKSWRQLKREMVRSLELSMANVQIDTTMQRLLNIDWVLQLLNEFVVTKVIPIQVYQPNPDALLYLAWDGQHTLVLLWLIATQIFEEDPQDIEIPVNIYSSHQKAIMRMSFTDLNTFNVGKKGLDQFDIFEQMVYGVRVDGSTNPTWEEAEQKQTILERHGLFATAKKFGDHDQPGAISRMQEITKHGPESLDWLCDYLVAVGANKRPVEEKEMVMMSYFFDRCRIASHKKLMKVDKNFIFAVAGVAKQYWAADFSPTSKFWVKAGNAYRSWHAEHVVVGTPHFSKEPNHGYPFLVEQLKKSLPNYKFPDNRSSSEFVPMAEDLF